MKCYKVCFDTHFVSSLFIEQLCAILLTNLNLSNPKSQPKSFWILLNVSLHSGPWEYLVDYLYQLCLLDNVISLVGVAAEALLTLRRPGGCYHVTQNLF